jgi:MscS family membrane protein
VSAKSFRCLLLTWLAAGVAWAQPAIPSPPSTASSPPTPQDTLGRTTPRGTVLGFLFAERKEQSAASVQYLNTRLQGNDAAELTHKLYVLLDRGLPAKLNELSDRPEGSHSLSNPDEELVGTISSNDSKLDIVLERVTRGKAGPIWLFSRKTLDSVPNMFEEFDVVSVDDVLPRFLVEITFVGVPLFEWLSVLVVMPLFYVLTTLLNRLLRRWAGRLRRFVRRKPGLPDPEILPVPVRLLVLVLIIRWTLSRLSLPLLARQLWSSVATTITIAAFVWAFILFAGLCEGYIRARMVRRNQAGAISILRFAGRTVDLLAVFVGILVALYHFGVNPTAAMAGLGVGGIAVALAAQKTLENVIGGISLILDNAVRVGDLLKVGEALGFVQEVGLRSTRIRTFDRTVITVPNGQLANVQLENISIRDKFWFHHTVRLRYETTAGMLRSILQGVNDLLTQHAAVERSSVWVRFLRIGTSSLDVEIFAYARASDWPHFLETQQELLLRIMEIVQAAGALLAFPTQTMYLEADHASDGAHVQALQPSDPTRPVRVSRSAARPGSVVPEGAASGSNVGSGPV